MYSIIVALFIFLFIEGPHKPGILRAPLDIPLVLSANFGELRSGHFHSGIDFKTEGVSGKQVFAVADGYVYRISVSPGGFGKALYIKHSNGLSTVYGHLSKFNQSIEEYVKDNQYLKKSFSVNLFPESSKFIVKQGEIIALTGNSGSSQGPHLHFEVRKSDNEKPIDPIQYFPIEDNIKPVIKSIAIYPVNNATTINNNKEKLKLNVSGSKGLYRIISDKPIEVSGPIGLGINTYDFFDNSWNKCGVRIINVQLDDKLVYCHSIDEFSFSESRYINSHIDYEEKIRTNTNFQKTFTEPNNRLSIYNHIIDNGIIYPEDEGIHRVKISVSDFNNNCSDIEFEFHSIPMQSTSHQPDKPNRIMPYGDENSIIHHDIRLNFPKDCFYDTIYFNYRKAPTEIEGLFADLHYVHNQYTPAHKSFNIEIKPKIDSVFKYYDKLCLVYLLEDNSGEYHFAGGEWDKGFVKGKVSELGIYSIGIDTIPPEINPHRITKGSTISGNTPLIIIIDDDFSGIKDYKGYIDGKWALFEWDPKNKTLLYYPDPERLEKGKQHELMLEVSDNRDNISKLDFSFVW